MNSKRGHAEQHVQEQQAVVKMMMYSLIEVIKLASSPTMLHCLLALKSYSAMLCLLFCFLLISVFCLQKSSTGILGLGLFQACSLSVQIKKSGRLPLAQNSTKA